MNAQRLVVGLYLVVAVSALGQAAPLPPGLEKFHKDGIVLSPEAPAVIQGELGAKDGPRFHRIQLIKGQTYAFALEAGFAPSLKLEDDKTGARPPPGPIVSPSAAAAARASTRSRSPCSASRSWSIRPACEPWARTGW
jgi:hypothetical protein